MNLPLITRAEEHNTKIAIVTDKGGFSYGNLLDISSLIATTLLQDTEDLQEQRVAFLIPPGFEYVATQWGIWRAGGIAVPLCVSHPRPELEYVITNSGVSIIVAHPQFEDTLRAIATEKNLPLILTSQTPPNHVTTLPNVDIKRRAFVK